MYRLFTIEEATSMIPTVENLLAGMQDAAQELSRVQEVIERSRPLSVEAMNARQEAGFLLREMHESKAELDRLGVQVKDFEAGVVDFPSQLGAEVVWLSWERGTEEITHYHRVGDNTARPLPAPGGDAGLSEGR